MQRPLHAAWASAVFALTACSRTDSPDETPPTKTAPWPAEGAPVATRGEQLALYRLLPEGDVRFDVPGRRSTLRGRIRRIEGRLTVDQADLARSRGIVRLDLASVEVESLVDTAASTSNSAFPFEWLGLSPSHPESAPEQLRWARFELTELHDLSAPTPSLGKLVEVSDAFRTNKPGDARRSTSSIVRSVTARAVATLDVHMHRTLTTVDLRVAFELPRHQDTGSKATAIEITNTSPLVVSLDAHDIGRGDTLERPSRDKHLRRRNGATRFAKVTFALLAELVEP